MTRIDASFISDLVPTHSDEVTRKDLQVLRALKMTDDDEGVFAEPTLETTYDATML